MQPLHLKQPSPELIASAKVVLQATAHTERIRPVIEQIKRKALAEGAYVNAMKNEPITKISDIWLMDEADMEEYLKRIDILYKEAGFYVEFGTCPLLIAESEERNAKRQMIELSQELHDAFDVSKVLKHVEPTKVYVNILLKHLKPFIK